MHRQTALDIYRALPQSDRLAYFPTPGMRGAPAARSLQAIAHYLACPQRHPVPEVLATWRERYARPTRETSLTPIPLGPQDAGTTSTVVRDKYRRLKNWNPPAATTDRTRNRHYQVRDEGRYSLQCTYTHYTYTPCLLSAGRVSPDGSVLGAVIDTGTYTLLAPRGYRWGIDVNGIRLYRAARPDDDYHPTSDDVRAGSRHIAAQLRTHAEIRRTARRAKRQQDSLTRLACAHGVWVSVVDSRAAGNCLAGTLAYCDRHGLVRSKHYRAEVLLRAEDSARVRAAIAAAQTRQLTDWVRGYSDLPIYRRLSHDNLYQSE